MKCDSAVPQVNRIFLSYNILLMNMSKLHYYISLYFQINQRKQQNCLRAIAKGVHGVGGPTSTILAEPVTGNCVKTDQTCAKCQSVSKGASSELTKRQRPKLLGSTSRKAFGAKMLTNRTTRALTTKSDFAALMVCSERFLQY